MSKVKLSAVVITFNEESNIARCLASLAFCDEVVVVDSGSSDRTAILAAQLGARVVVNSFVGYGEQKNLGAGLAMHDWILSVDADEEVSAELRATITAWQAQPLPADVACYQVARQNFFCGRPIRYGGWYPDFNARLYHRGRASWTTPKVHEALRPHQGPVGQLSGDLNHYTFTTIRQQILTNLKYAELGAADLVRTQRAVNVPLLLLKPLTKFIECYLLKRGCLDGFFGLVIALNASYSIFLKYLFALTGQYPRLHDE